MKNKNNKKSFDVFDTLITRLVPKPIDIFYIIEKKYRLPGFMSARIMAETKLRVASNSEPTLFEIYSLLSKVNKEYDKINEEMEMEYKFSRPIFENINSIKNGDCYISDMYLPGDFVSKLLAKNGIQNVFPGINLFVSSDYNKTKRSGELYAFVESLIGKPISHIGDHKISDYEVPSKLGINSKIYKENIETEISSILNENNRDLEYFIFGVVRAMSLAQMPNKNRVIIDVYLKKIIPLIYCFSRWVVNTAINRGITEIYFLARDGYLPYLIANAIAGNELKVKYIKISRSALKNSLSAKNYLTSEGIEEGKNIAIVDAGWHGSMQNRISDLYNGRINIHGLYLGISDNNKLKSKDYSAYLFSPKEGEQRNKFVMRHVPEIEFLLAAPHGSIANIFENSSGQFLFDYYENERFGNELMMDITELTIEFANNMKELEIIADDNLKLNRINDKRIICNFKKLLACPSVEFSRALQGYQHYESNPDESTLLVAEYASFKHLFGLNKTWWQEATLSLSFLGRIKNRLLLSYRVFKEYLI